MAFDSATINVSINGDTPVATWRQDAAAANSIVGSLSSGVGVNTYRWRLIGRPEGSAAGGAGPEPLSLGTATTCAFTVDIPGTYIVECLVNGGAPDATIITAGCAILETITTGDGRTLRLLGPGETNQDISDPLVVQGWIKELNRWLRYLSVVSGGGGSDHLVLVQTGGTPGTLAALITSADGSVIATVTGTAPNLQLSLTANPNNPAGLYYLKTGSGSSAPTQLVKPPHINAGGNWTAALTSSYAAIVTASTLTDVLSQANLNDPYLSILPAGPYRFRLHCEATVASSVYFTVSSNGIVIATSAAAAVPSGSSLIQYDLYATAALDTVLADPTLPLVLKVYAKANTGTATLTVGGASANNATLSCPWCGNHAYTHVLGAQDALPAASTTVAGLVEFDTANPQPNGTADPGSSGLAAQSDHVHEGGGTGDGKVKAYVDGTAGYLIDKLGSDYGTIEIRLNESGDEVELEVHPTDIPNGYLWPWDNEGDTYLHREICSSDPGAKHEVVITSSSSIEDGMLADGASFSGDPNHEFWMAGFVRLKLFLKVDTASAEIFFSLSRKPALGGAVVPVISATSLGTIAWTVYTALIVDIALPESVGLIDDNIQLNVWAVTTSGSSVTVSMGLDDTYPSRINLPLVIPVLPGS